MSNVQVSVQNVERYFPRGPDPRAIHALGPINLDLVKGEFFSIVGPSGCGKSTLLEIIAGLNEVTEGSVLFEGTPIRGVVPNGVGVVFQEDASFPWLSVKDNIAFGLRQARVPTDDARQRIDDALGLMGLRDFADAYPAQLSGGMRQRVCIARTLVLKPHLILLDEPFGALDQQTRMLMGDELLRLWRATDATVLLITHSLDEAAMLSDRVGVMSARPGRIKTIVDTKFDKNDPNLFKTKAFVDKVDEIWNLVRDEAIKAQGNRVP